MVFGKLLSLPASLRRPLPEPAARSLGPNHVSTPKATDTDELQRQGTPLCRESISQRTLTVPACAPLRPGQVAQAAPLDYLGRRLAQAESIPEIISTLEHPSLALQLFRVRRLSLVAASGQADMAQFQIICARLAQRCPNLEQLDVADAVLSAIAAQSLAKLPALAVLALNNHACEHRRRQPLPDGVLAHLAQSPKLHTLMLGNANLPDMGVVPLQKLTTLRSLSLSNCAFLAHDVESLGALHELTSFYHRSDEDCSAVVHAVAGLLQLETLYLAKLRLDRKGIDISALQSLRHLHRLHVDEARLTQASLRTLGKGCAVLVELELHAPHLDDGALSGLRFFTYLKALKISDATGTQPAASPVLALRKHRLCTLEMPGGHLTSRSRHALLRAFGAEALTYSGFAQVKKQDRSWLDKHNLVDEGHLDASEVLQWVPSDRAERTLSCNA